MNNNKQSSVEWLFKQLWDEPKDKLNWYAILEQAKAMHKEESINLTKHWYNQWEQGKGMTISEYYDQEFNNK